MAGQGALCPLTPHRLLHINAELVRTGSRDLELRLKYSITLAREGIRRFCPEVPKTTLTFLRTGKTRLFLILLVRMLRRA